MSFLAELKRRNVIRMAGLYLVGAWLLIQIAETLLPAFDVPGWVLRAIIIVLALGFLPTLVFSWVFELTPDGLKRDGDVAVDASVAAQTGRRMEKLILGGLVLVVALIAADRLWPGAAVAGSDSLAAPTDPASGRNPAAASEPDAAPTVPVAAASIAVLPFENMSADVENGFFADGISEELLNVLAGIEGLTVASRTSSFTFKGTKTPVPEIARQLGVQHVLEGSVRKQGDRVRITAQLIHATTDAHLWSETYDRDLSDIFKVQEEIAQAISDELVGLLPVAPRISVTASTADLEAYERFLRGRSRFHQRREMLDGLADLQFAVGRDPELGEAWVFLAATQYVLPGYDSSLSFDDAAADAASSLVKARRLEPGHALVHALEGVLQSREKGYLAGIDKLAYAASVRSTDSTPLLWYGLAQLHVGYIDQAVETLERATRMDPFSGIANGYLAIALISAGDQARGAEAAERASELGWPIGSSVYMIELARAGDKAAALAIDRQTRASPDLEFARENSAFIAALEDPGKLDDFLALVGPAPSEGLLALDQTDLFMDNWLKGAQSGKSVLGQENYSLRIAWMPSTREVREDPRFFEIATASRLVDLWEERGYPPGCSRAKAPGGDHLDCAGMTHNEAARSSQRQPGR